MSVLTCPQGHTLGDISDWAIKKLKKLGFTDMDIEMLERLYAMFACANLYALAMAGRKLSTT